MKDHTKRFALSLLGAAVMIAYSGVAHAEPNLTIPESFFDFGYVPQNSQLNHIFWLKSTGTDSLFIDKIVPG